MLALLDSIGHFILLAILHLVTCLVLALFGMELTDNEMVSYAPAGMALWGIAILRFEQFHVESKLEGLSPGGARRSLSDLRRSHADLKGKHQVLQAQVDRSSYGEGY